MALVLHLSDLHLTAPLTPGQTTVLGLLFQAIAREGLPAGELRALVITGDVFDTSSLDREAAAIALRDFCAGLRAAVGPSVPILILPGNHDRRRLGVVGPEDLTLFRALARAAGPDVHVLGNQSPFSAELIPEAVHRLPFHVVAYDSTILPGGLVSAGGIVQQEDLLQISAEIDAIDGVGPRRPLLLLLHHHLVPTPVTDLSHIQLTGLPRSLVFLFEHGLRNVIAHGDREELTMTALGAGTALSTLCSLGRPVLVLHGHKHYPTARLLKGVRQDEGDILIGSAGSSGRVEHWRPTDVPSAASVWPSFNRIEIAGQRVTVESVGFSDRKPDKPVQRRRMVEATWIGPRWELAPVPADTDDRPSPLDLNESVVRLYPNASDGGATWDADVQRTLRWADPASPRPADDLVEGLPDGQVHVLSGDGVSRLPLPARVRVPSEGHITYHIERAACRTLAEGRRRYGKRTAHEWMGQLVRHASVEARLVLRGLPPARKLPFGSATSLTGGEERAVPLARTAEGVSLMVPDCPPLTLLRIYWPLPEA